MRMWSFLISQILAGAPVAVPLPAHASTPEAAPAHIYDHDPIINQTLPSDFELAAPAHEFENPLVSHIPNTPLEVRMEPFQVTLTIGF